MSEEYNSVIVSDGTSCVLENLIPGTQYQVWVVAYCGGGSVTTTKSTFTTAGSQDPELLCPVPTDLVVFAVGTDEATLNWYPGSEEQSTWYFYYRKKGTSSWSEELVSGGGGMGLKKHTLYNLEPNTTYQVYITGTCFVKSIGYFVDNPSASNQIEFTTEALGCITPSDVEVSEITASEATLTWAPGSESQNQWYVSLKKHSDSSWQKFAVSSSIAVLTGLQQQTSYDVKVSSQCGSAESTSTAVTTFTTGAPGQGIETTPSDSPSRGEKILRDGQLLIIVGDKMYDARGAEVR
jgi:hypothetical protein